ncbi:MAG: hypothetical protein WCK18_07240 [Prolixibacteraceae bacterium]
MFKKKLIFSITLLIYSILYTNRVASQQLFDPIKGLNFEMQDVLESKLYDWPETLLSYPILFNKEVNIGRLVLQDLSTGRSVPFQLSEIKIGEADLTSARLNFLATLPSGGKFSFRLTQQSKVQLVNLVDPVKVSSSEKEISIGTKLIQIKIPDSQMIGKFLAPAPIIGVNNGKGWIGDNRLHSPRQKITEIQTKTIEKGDLFTVHQIDYRFDNGGLYRVNLKLITGYPFVIMDEKMVNISKSDSVKAEYSWTNFHPAYRWANQWDRADVRPQPWIGIDQPLYTNYLQEDPHWSGQGWVEDPAKEMIYFLIPFAGNAVREQSPHISFWETGKDGNELGLFVYDFNAWNDNDYGIWQTSTTLGVKFRYANKVLCWRYPISKGSRSTAICLFPTSTGEKKVEEIKSKIAEMNKTSKYRPANELVFRYPQILQQQYATLNLNKVKDWDLAYGLDRKRPQNPFASSQESSSDEFYKSVTTGLFSYYPLGVNNFPGVHAIEHRIVYSNLVEGYLKHYKELAPDKRKKVEALFLLSAYVNSQEDMNAIRSGLSGTANMAADGWCVPAQMSFLFPEHPMAKEWLDFYKKELEINGLFYTRPEVKNFESKGGRWVESLATYNWAYLRPTSFSNIAGILTDGKNRWANQYFAERGKWMVNVVTAPVYNPDYNKRRTISREGFKAPKMPEGWSPGDSLTIEKGFERHYPAHGAHGNGTTVPPFASAWQLANWMMFYDPMVAENLFWMAGPKYDFEGGNHTDWVGITKKMYPTFNNGTNPDLKSSKYTGQGIILRSGVGTTDEISLHLDQIDKGPNYRWGHQGQGGTGSLYFYAGGKIYTGHENEANGDLSQNNTDFVTNFGVMKNGTFTNIGPNELTSPLFNLEVAQFGELLSDKEHDRYAWPEYVSRSALLVGTDYFLLYDQTGTNWRSINRFSWFIAKDMEYPNIIFLSNGGRSQTTTAQTITSRGFYRDNDGSSFAVVAPRGKEVKVSGIRLSTPLLLNGEPIYESQKNPGYKYPEGIFEIKTASSTDLIFRNDYKTVFSDNAVSISGKTGVIRRYKTGEVQLALVNGSKIGVDNLLFEFDHDQLGWSAISSPDGELHGKAKMLKSAVLKVSGEIVGSTFYLNGKPLTDKISSKQVEVKLPEGEFYWEISTKGGTPQSPVIERTEYLKKGVMVYFSNPAMTKKIAFEISKDGGKSWTKAGLATNSSYLINPIAGVTKIHVRAIAIGKLKESHPSQAYPVYFEAEKPHFPEGLALTVDSNCVQLSWGQLFGVKEYRLYRRTKGEKQFVQIYKGLGNRFEDKTCSGVVPPFSLPGKLDNAEKKPAGLIIYEYSVTSLNGKGESKYSPVEDTDPASWANWYPGTKLKFKRQTSFWLPPYVNENMVPDKYYPE